MSASIRVNDGSVTVNTFDNRFARYTEHKGNVNHVQKKKVHPKYESRRAVIVTGINKKVKYASAIFPIFGKYTTNERNTTMWIVQKVQQINEYAVNVRVMQKRDFHRGTKTRVVIVLVREFTE